MSTSTAKMEGMVHEIYTNCSATYKIVLSSLVNYLGLSGVTSQEIQNPKGRWSLSWGSSEGGAGGLKVFETMYVRYASLHAYRRGRPSGDV